MKIILNNGTELEPYVVTGAHRQVQGSTRDTLTFVFPVSAGLDTLDGLFTAENCESITIIADEGSSYIHKGYTIRTEMVQKSVEVEMETAESAAVYEDRITVTMAQRTYMESQLASLTETVDVLVMDSLMA